MCALGPVVYKHNSEGAGCAVGGLPPKNPNPSSLFRLQSSQLQSGCFLIQESGGGPPRKLPTFVWRSFRRAFHGTSLLYYPIASLPSPGDLHPPALKNPCCGYWGGVRLFPFWQGHHSVPRCSLYPLSGCNLVPLFRLGYAFQVHSHTLLRCRQNDFCSRRGVK